MAAHPLLSLSLTLEEHTQCKHVVINM